MTPLLVTGLPRSGTSWAGKMLEASGQVVYVNEPLNPQHPPGHSPGVLNATVTHRFQYICPENEGPWLRAFRDTIALRYGFAAELRRNRGPYDLARMAKYGTAFTLGRLRGRRAMLDDPFAVLSARWFAERLGCRVVVLVRDPVAFTGSWMRLGWTVRFRELLDQPLLMRDLLGPYSGELRALDGSADRLAVAATLWRVVHAVLPESPRVRVTPYEELVRDPVGGFRELYAFCGLEWTGRAAARVAASCSRRRADRGGKAFGWSGLSRTAYRPMDPAAALNSYRDRLTPAEIARVRELTSGWDPGRVSGGLPG
ncbi:sulfotransferase [Bailinhaonella thermotolerans]|uniref:Sulfotransferase n=1 Tax=Bailinhaonella thermotolerans TaxID=1070861 RepID=A0A3A4AY03_9ACTN|nr:sulfotransferase [Bailinhaonella thermotolerans]RJL33289.1 sulfotransferase [Bailinhaonella thermotolerans]